MLNARALALVGASLALLAGCGSTARTNTTTAKTAAIDAALHELQQHVRALEREQADTVSLEPPRGVGPAEWEAAVQSDLALPAAIRALVSGKGATRAQ